LIPVSIDIEGIFNEYVAKYQAGKSSPPPLARSLSAPSGDKPQEQDHFTLWVTSLKTALLEAEAKAVKARREDEKQVREELDKKKCEEVLEKASEISDSSVETQKLCVVCMENPKVICFSPCGHIATCERCDREHLEKCPLCQANITSRQRAYF